MLIRNAGTLAEELEIVLEDMLAQKDTGFDLVRCEECDHKIFAEFSGTNSYGEDVNESFSVPWEESHHIPLSHSVAGAVSSLAHSAYARYNNFNIDEYVIANLEAKRNGAGGVPEADDLVKAGRENEANLYKLSRELINEAHYR